MKKLITIMLMVVMLASGVRRAAALDVGGLLKDGAIIVGGGAAVTLLSKQLNDFINTITFNKGAKFEGYTKVVPILSLGTGAHIGAAQVGATTQSALDRTQAVGQLEGDFKAIRARALIPIDSLNPIKQFKRVQGVGVTAIIDVKL